MLRMVTPFHGYPQVKPLPAGALQALLPATVAEVKDTARCASAPHCLQGIAGRGRRCIFSWMAPHSAQRYSKIGTIAHLLVQSYIFE